jgi:hypothetical protein
MSALTNVQEASNLVSLVANQAIVQPYGDPYTIGISGLIFDIVGRVSVKATADVTDHFVEANYAIQDHVALRPIIVTMEGRAAELVDYFSPGTLEQIFSAVGGLGTLAGLGPTFNVQAAQVYSEISSVASLAQNIVNTAQSLFEIIQGGMTVVTKQQTVFTQLMSMRNSRQLCQVETPYGVFEDMIIEDLDCEQTEETTKVSNFTIRFKQILTVQAVQGTSSAGSTDSQNSGTTSTLPGTPADGLIPYTADAVSLGSGYGVTTPTDTMLGVFQNQAGT